MKKLVTLVLAIITLTLSSCSNDENVIKTTVQVSVLTDGSPYKDRKVYLFESPLGREPIIANAKANVVTSNNGTATFVLEDVKDITLTDTPQTFWFVIFNPSTPAKSVSIKKGETKSITFSYAD